MTMGNTTASSIDPVEIKTLDIALAELDVAKDLWAQTPTSERISLLLEIKHALMTVAEGWSETAARQKQIPAASPLVGEEWISGPYGVMSTCNGLIQTLSQMEGKAFVKHLPTRKLVTGQTAVQVMPHTIWDRFLLSGIHAEVWMQQGVNEANLAEHTAVAYAQPPHLRKGKVALVLGAGNIASIAPLDVFQKLFLENQVVILKMNPVNDYLTDYLLAALKPLVDRNFIRIVKGDGAVGAYLSDHPLVEELHITGSQTTHDIIIWGAGKEGVANRKVGKRKNNRPITSELGAVCPTIVVPGPWSNADINFQAQNVATQKLHNSGFNCIACQVLIMPKGWNKGDRFMRELKSVMESSTRPAYYPGVLDRLGMFKKRADKVVLVNRRAAPAVIINDIEDDDWFRSYEVFGPAMSIKEMDGSDAETYLVNAIAYANEQLHGTLGANILIHPVTLREIGRNRFEEILAGLRYGTIAVNGWTGLGFLITACPWGAYPGHTLEDVQSGIGTVHNTFMLTKTERTVVWAPFRPFPRGLLSFKFNLLPRPPWFITNRRQHVLGRLLTDFQYKPGWLKLPRIFMHALLG